MRRVIPRHLLVEQRARDGNERAAICVCRTLSICHPPSCAFTCRPQGHVCRCKAADAVHISGFPDLSEKARAVATDERIK